MRQQREKLDSFDKQVIRRTIHKLYEERILPTVRIIQARLAAKTTIKVSNSKLKLVLHELGYSFTRTEVNRCIAVERSEAVAARANFLREIRKCRAAGMQVIYVDETWVNQYSCRSLAWYPKLSLMDEFMKQKEIGIQKLPNIPSGKGKRIVILHAGSAEKGFIPECELVFLGMHDDKGDYHTEMNTKLFMQWFEKLANSLEEPSVIILDNASYHNALTEDTKAPNMSARKGVMAEWLSKKNIPFSKHAQT